MRTRENGVGKREGREKGYWLKGGGVARAFANENGGVAVVGEGDREGERGLPLPSSDWPWWLINSVLFYFILFF